MRSYGLSEDNEVQLWAGGRSGWFEISPSAAYQAMYDLMAQAVQLYFFFLDELQGPQKKMQKSFTLRTALSMVRDHQSPAPKS